MRPAEWKDGELGYCLGIVRTRGDRNVPREMVASYLDIQAASARHDSEPVLADALQAASREVAAGEWDRAYKHLITLMT